LAPSTELDRLGIIRQGELRLRHPVSAPHTSACVGTSALLPRARLREHDDRCSSDRLCEFGFILPSFETVAIGETDYLSVQTFSNSAVESGTGFCIRVYSCDSGGKSSALTGQQATVRTRELNAGHLCVFPVAHSIRTNLTALGSRPAQRSRVLGSQIRVRSEWRGVAGRTFRRASIGWQVHFACQ